MVRLAFAIACCALAVGTAAQAQTTVVTGQAGTSVNAGAPLGGVGVAQSNLGAVTYASTITIAPTPINPDQVTFHSGNALTGRSIGSTSFTDVNLAMMNRVNSANLPVLHSEIMPAGMGFYMADTRTCVTNPQTCAQSQGFATLTDLRAAAGVTGATTLGGASFDFSIVANDHTLYSVHGSMSLNINANGRVSISTDVDDAAAKLAGFTTLELGNEGSALGFAWDATQVPAILLKQFDAQGRANVNYEVSVSSFTNGACLADGFTCLVAYSAFGDPIGRGGGTTDADFRAGGQSFLGGFGGGALGPHQNSGVTFINGVTINDVTIDAPRIGFAGPGGVPEPATWISVILGFGLLGAALRRRRVVAYT